MASAILDVISDTYISSMEQSASFGNAGNVSSGRWYKDSTLSSTYQTQGFWRLHPSHWPKIPVGANITSAYLYLKCIITFNRINTPIGIGENYGGWSPATLNWNNRPTGSVPFDTQYFSPGSFVGFNILNYVKKARFANIAYRDFGLRTMYTGGAVQGANFYPSESGQAAYCVVNYIADPAGFVSLTDDGYQFYLNGNDVNGASVKIYSAPYANGSYVAEPNPSISGDTFRLADRVMAPGPSAPQVSLSIVNGSSIQVNWTVPSQASVNRAYKWHRILSDGTTSQFNGPAVGTLTPYIKNYIVERSINNGIWTTIKNTTSTSFVDANVPTNSKCTYRVTAVNSQFTESSTDTTPPSITINPPSSPIISSVTEENGSVFRLKGTGASELLNVYVSTDGSNYEKQNSVQPDGSTWNILIDPNINQIGNTSPPNPPTFDIQHVAEKAIDLKWVKPTVPATKRWFKVSNTVNNVESALTPAVAATLTPKIVGYRVERKLATDTVYSVIYPVGQQVSDGTEDGIRDTGVDFGGNYVYRLIAKSSRAQESTPVMKNAAAALPLPPTIMPLRKINNSDKSQNVLLSGKGLSGATEILVKRLALLTDPNIVQSQAFSVWEELSTKATLGTPANPVGGEEWFLEDKSILTNAPRIPTWVNNERPVDTEGIYLRWEAPTNLATTLSYKASRVKSNIKGQDSPVVTVTVVPFITKYTIYRKEELTEGQTKGPEHEFAPIKTIVGTALNPSPPTRFDHTDPTEVLPSKKYTYKIVATNNFGKNSGESTVKTFSTFDAPPAVKPPPPIPPALENPRPKGALDISGGGTVRLVWDFKHVNNEKQTSYALRVRYSESGVTKTKYWDGVNFVDDATVRVESSNTFADVPIDFFKNGVAYKVAVSARSTQGATGGGIFSSDDVVAAADDTGDSEFLEWDIAGSEHHTVYFPTRRAVTKNYTSYFPLYRKVRTANDDQLALPPLAVSWAVEPQLPFDVNDEKWAGSGNSWIWQVSDRDGRPEPYAEIDFEKDGFSKTFKGDSRGRFVLTVPGDIDPGIYTFRERGPTMAPRTTRNFPLTDPAIIYGHGQRHGADGDDPISGITKEQIADNANIHPSQVQGGAALGELVDAYGSNIRHGLEKTVSAGHGYYVVEGLDVGAFAAPNLPISTGVCWEDDRLRNVGPTSVQFLFDGRYKVFVQNGTIRHEIRVDYPPRTTPLYNVVIFGGQTAAVVTDERLRHGDGVAPTTLEPVHWGAESTDDIKHGDTTLKYILDTNLKELRDRSIIEEKLHDKFFADVSATQEKVDNYGKNLLKAREAQLALGYTTTMKQLYSYMSRRAAQNLLLDNATKLQDANMSDVLNYLSSISDGGFNHSNSHVSAFMPKDELSSLTSVLVTNGIARLPNNWTKGTQYTLRTLRIEGTPAQFIEFHLIYEFTKATFDVFGSLANNGRYIPKKMLKMRTVKDDNLKTMFGSVENVYIDTYRAYFDDPGNESVIELLVQGGDPGDGVRLRGFSIVTA